jgi:serine/threonine protein kinase/Tfp pilus assembly protein PilF
MNEASIFAAALEKPNADQRAAYLTQACAGDARLRRRVEALLRAHAEPDEILDSPLTPTADGTPLAERPGSCIGPYKLLQQIGEGGMGVVFMAEQDQPVRRKVALKIIKPGMDSAQVVARFEAERQALAMMDHTNIARVFDAGATESGRPYFVMELVHGVPITTYCDENVLTPRQRLELFVPICQAIQHAHQKGIIHRDIKPSNILVTMYDDKPVPKVIDFGVAKAVEQRLTEKSLFTQFGTLVGTFEYMSPEQAEMNAFGVDTRSDIYALGVLLYELLTGTTPLERARLREAAFDEIRRIIKEEEPQRPSVRLSTSGTLAKVAAARQTEPTKLSRLLRGELDWVVMKCLEKDRSRRYDTASNLARDVERFLKDEPVEARPPSVWYRLRKAARRNRAALTVAGVVVAALVVGGAATLWQASIARADRERAELAEARRIKEQAIADAKLKAQEEERIAERRQEKLDRAIEAALGGDLAKADKAIVEAEKAGVARDQGHWLRGLVHYQQGKFEEAIREFKAAIALKPNSVAAHAMHAMALFVATVHSGNGSGRSFLEWNDLNAMTPETAEDYLCRGYLLGHVLWANRAQALADLDKAIAMRDTPIAHAFRAQVLSYIAFDERDLPLAERALDDLLQAKRRLQDNKFVRLISLIRQLAVADMYSETGQPEKQKAALEEAGRDAKELEGIPVLLYVMTRVDYFERIGDRDRALKELEEASRRPETSDLVTNYALALYERGKDDNALSVLNARLTPDNTAGQMLRIILWAEQPDVGPDKAYERYRKWLAEREANGREPSLYQALPLLLLGRKKEATDFADVFFKDPPGTAAARFEAEAKAVQNTGKGRRELFNAHMRGGLTRLSDGDRAGAKVYFQKALDTKVSGHNAYPYLRAFLARMDRDEKWPRWIEAKKK